MPISAYILPRAAHAARRYSQRIHHTDTTRMQLLLAHSAITAGVVLPFVHPYLQTRKAKKDGSCMTKKPIPFTPSPKF